MPRASKSTARTAAKKRPAEKRPATKKTTPKKGPAKTVTTKKAPAKKKAAAKKTAAKATPTKAAAKKSPASKAVAKNTAAKNTAAKNTAAKKKAVAKTPAAKKAPIKKAAAAAPKNAAKKTPAKKAATKAPVKKAPPKKKVSPYDKKFLEAQRESLITERLRLSHDVDALNAEANELAMMREPGDVQFDEESGEGDTLAVERERDLALSAQFSSQIEDIDHALSKIDGGTYGLCEVSGLAIPKERLRAIPWARERVEYKVGGFRR